MRKFATTIRHKNVLLMGLAQIERNARLLGGLGSLAIPLDLLLVFAILGPRIPSARTKKGCSILACLSKKSITISKSIQSRRRAGAAAQALSACVKSCVMV